MSTTDKKLKAWHHLIVKMKQLFCLHGDYVYLELTTQATPATGKVISFAAGCKRCGFVNHKGGYGMPKIGRNSYDKTYLKITDKHDRLLSDTQPIKQRSDRSER